MTRRAKALDGAVDHVDRVVAQRAVDGGLPRTLPALELVLAQPVDEIVLLAGGQLGEATLMLGAAGAIDAAQGGAVEVDIRRPRLGDPQAEQRMRGRHRELLIDEMGDAVLPRPDGERLADRLERRHLVSREYPERHPLGAGLPGGEQHLRARYREHQRAERRAGDEVASNDLCHGGLPY